ncbi:CCXG family PEP-CTERM protein [uncultured Massilia sp.]|uniref:CCXG family PEP-CTERM protein n=1 Tax=uncultured Massilia sp. TaxID=169973 RepID=UPI0025F9540F|nr:CCXG family PEP-CTERM protein [uncultured Massilia sp.]
MNSAQTLCVAILAVAAAQADASVITLQTAYSTAGVQGSGNAYRSAVDTALLHQGSGYGTATLASYDNVSNSKLFGGVDSNIAWKATIDFAVAADQAATTWSFRAGVDFGYGGALFLDGVAVDTKSWDMYWSNNYNNSSQYFLYSTKLGAGNHTLAIYGLEKCCDGVQQAQFKIGDGNYTTFASTDGLNPKVAAVPEPATIASFALGLGLIAGLRRRGKRG